jgi:hypothetical protein
MTTARVNATNARSLDAARDDGASDIAESVPSEEIASLMEPSDRGRTLNLKWARSLASGFNKA